VLRVGLTGGIACGKSHVLARLAAAGLATLDLDRVAHQVMAPGGSAYAPVVAAFGPGILGAGGAVDRQALGALVFRDAAARERLNAIVHPRVREEEQRWAAALAARGEAVAVTDAALLVESGVHLRFQRLVVVHCAPAEQLRRLMARDGLDEAAARARLAAQMPLEEKRRFAHYPIDTSGTVAETHAAADRLAHELRGLAEMAGDPIEVPLDRAAGAIVLGPAEGPRGLNPAGVLAVIVASRGLEMEVLARRLQPPADGPWYRAARTGGAGGPGPETLMAPVVLWALRRGLDPPFLLQAAASLARLTHADAAAVANACFAALVLTDVAVAGAIPPDLDARAAAWAGLASQWAGGPVSLSVASLSGTLGGLARGTAGAMIPQPLGHDLEALAALSRD
jgi:dephospho-CoA kinase